MFGKLVEACAAFRAHCHVALADCLAEGGAQSGVCGVHLGYPCHQVLVVATTALGSPGAGRYRPAQGQRHGRGECHSILVAALQRTPQPASLQRKGPIAAAFQQLLGVKVGPFAVGASRGMHDQQFFLRIPTVQIGQCRVHGKRGIQAQRGDQIGRCIGIAAQISPRGITDRWDGGQSIERAAQQNHNQAVVSGGCSIASGGKGQLGWHGTSGQAACCGAQPAQCIAARVGVVHGVYLR